jgi:hypothetical protein
MYHLSNAGRSFRFLSLNTQTTLIITFFLSFLAKPNRIEKADTEGSTYITIFLPEAMAEDLINRSAPAKSCTLLRWLPPTTY